MFKNFTVLMGLICLMSLSNCSPTSISKRTGFHLCGDRLVEALMLICDGNIYSPGQNNGVRRREASEEGAVDFFTDLGPYPQLSRRQLANECCVNSCSFADLASYCAR